MTRLQKVSPLTSPLLPYTYEAFFLLAVLLRATLLERVLITDSVSMLGDMWSIPVTPPTDPSFFLLLLKNYSITRQVISCPQHNTGYTDIQIHTTILWGR